MAMLELHAPRIEAVLFGERGVPRSYVLAEMSGGFSLLRSRSPLCSCCMIGSFYYSYYKG